MRSRNWWAGAGFILLTACGCGTVKNLRPPRESIAGDDKKRVYGGLRDGLSTTETNFEMARVGMLTLGPLALFLNVLDLPLTAIGDTLTLPYTLAYDHRLFGWRCVFEPDGYEKALKALPSSLENMDARVTNDVVARGSTALNETPLRPAALLQGSHSLIGKESFRVIKTSDEWKTLWEEHRGEYGSRPFTQSEQSFDVDFETHLVVAVFTGNCDWCKVTPRRRGDAVVIGYRADVYQIVSFRSQNSLPTETEKAEYAKGEAKSPYALVVVPKPVRSVVIEQDVRREISAPPVWKHRKTFVLDD